MRTLVKLSPYPIYHFESDDRWELAMTFLRMEEYYESGNPDFKGKIFTFEEYTDWYVGAYRKSKKLAGAFTYASDWSAFNVPGYAVRAVLNNFPEHSKKESWLFRELILQGAFAESETDFYLIGNKSDAKKSYFAHEYRHALFAVNHEYKEEITQVVLRYPVLELREWILKHYAPSVLCDEIQAHALTGWPGDVRVTPEMRELRKELKLIERKYVTR